jgi:hypothetical protein
LDIPDEYWCEACRPDGHPYFLLISGATYEKGNGSSTRPKESILSPEVTESSISDSIPVKKERKRLNSTTESDVEVKTSGPRQRKKARVSVEAEHFISEPSKKRRTTMASREAEQYLLLQQALEESAEMARNPSHFSRQTAEPEESSQVEVVEESVPVVEEVKVEEPVIVTKIEVDNVEPQSGAAQPVEAQTPVSITPVQEDNVETPQAETSTPVPVPASPLPAAEVSTSNKVKTQKETNTHKKETRPSAAQRQAENTRQGRLFPWTRRVSQTRCV